MPEPPPLRQLLDHQEIMAAMAAYARCADLNEPEQQAAVFIEDCLVRCHPAESIIGWAALVQALGRYTRTSHHLGNIEIDFEGPDSAAGQSTVIAWHRRPDGSQWTLYGRYVDRRGAGGAGLEARRARAPRGRRRRPRRQRSAPRSAAHPVRRDSRRDPRPVIWNW